MMKPRDLVFAVLFAALAFCPLSIRAQGDSWSASHTAGVISTVQGSSLQLDNGRVVFLHHGTVINPTRTKLRPGMWIAVLGSPSSKDAIDANEIDVGPGPAMSGADLLQRYHGTFAYGTISTIQGSSLQLDNGRVVFLHPHTVIAPSGASLQVGMRIRVLGSPSSNGDAIDANAIQIGGTSARGT